MRNRGSIAIPVLLAAATLAFSPVLAADPPAVVGIWDTVASTPDGDLPGVMTITDEGGALDVVMEIGGFERDVSNEELEGALLTLTVLYDGSPYEVELTVDGDSMKGSYSGMAASGPLEAKRRP